MLEATLEGIGFWGAGLPDWDSACVWMRKGERPLEPPARPSPQLLAAWRMIRGPRAQDRILGLDTLYLNAMLLILVQGMRSGVGLYFEAALIIGMLGFTATVALAKFLMRGEVIE